MFNIKFQNACDGAYSSIDVRFTKACDNDCHFCIEKDGLDSLGKTDEEQIANQIISSGIKNVLILGGEPFLQIKKLHNFVYLIRDKVDTIYITTSLPKTVDLENQQVVDILNLVDGLNVSVQHRDWKKNNEIFSASSNHNRHEILRQLNMKFSEKIRTSINLVKGGIDSKYELEETLLFLSSVGCKHVKVNELQHTPNLYVSYEKIMNTNLPPAYSSGCQSYVSNFAGMRILLKRSCFVVENSQKANLKDLAKALYKKYFHKTTNRFRVVYENGMFRNQWEKK